jgi:hypothetical protein
MNKTNNNETIFILSTGEYPWLVKAYEKTWTGPRVDQLVSMLRPLVVHLPSVYLTPYVRTAEPSRKVAPLVGFCLYTQQYQGTRIQGAEVTDFTLVKACKTLLDLLPAHLSSVGLINQEDLYPMPPTLSYRSPY